MKTILILEDNDERIAAFQQIVAALGDGFEAKVWRIDATGNDLEVTILRPEPIKNHVYFEFGPR